MQNLAEENEIPKCNRDSVQNRGEDYSQQIYRKKVAYGPNINSGWSHSCWKRRNYASKTCTTYITVLELIFYSTGTLVYFPSRHQT
jgi:hypothetical protein